MSGSAVGQTLPVVYRRDAAGLIPRAWVLTHPRRPKLGGVNTGDAQGYNALCRIARHHLWRPPLRSRHGQKVFIKTFGCQMNEYDSDKMVDVMNAAQGYEPTQNVDEADLILFNTCSVREKAQEKVFSDLGRVQHLKQEGRADRCGRLRRQPGRRQEIIKRARIVDVVFGPRRCTACRTCWPSRRGRRSPRWTSASRDRKVRPPAARAGGRRHRVCSIMEGCSKYCSYCVVPYTRGDEVSRPFDEVLAEIAGLAEQGVREVTLLGRTSTPTAAPWAPPPTLPTLPC